MCEAWTQLFKRDKRHVELTPAGKRLVGVSKSILSHVRGYEESLRSLSLGRPLRIFCSQAGEQQMLPAVLRSLSKRVPDWNIEFSNIWPIEYVSALRENRVDVLLMVRPLDATGISFLPISREGWRAVVPAHSAAARRGSISMVELARNPLLVPSDCYCDWFRPRLRNMFGAFAVEPEMIDCPLYLSARVALVAGGKGNVICTESQAPPSSAEVRVLRIEETLPPYERGAAWRNSFDPVALSVFRDAVSEALGAKLAAAS